MPEPVAISPIRDGNSDSHPQSCLHAQADNFGKTADMAALAACFRLPAPLPSSALAPAPRRQLKTVASANRGIGGSAGGVAAASSAAPVVAAGSLTTQMPEWSALTLADIIAADEWEPAW